MNEHNLSAIPAAACTMAIGELEFGDNGEGAKTAPIRLVARSGKPINHWFWGRVAHDMAGMHLHKSRLPVDYCHDASEVIGYLNRFDVQSGDLIVSGALVPFKDSDRATEIIHKTRNGVPYEASINFAGDGIKIEEIGEGFTAQVNGYAFDGPGIIIREWPLRGVAVCPYGADQNTESKVLAGGKTYSAAVVTPEPETATEETDMDAKSVDVAAEAEQPVAALTEETQIEETVEAETAEAPAAALEAVEVVETEEAPQPVAELSRVEFLRIVADFGADVAAQVVKDGGDYVTALTLAHQAAKEENEALREQVQTLSRKGGSPAPVADARPKKTLRQLCEKGAVSTK